MFMAQNTAVVGLQWGDEGKGKIVGVPIKYIGVGSDRKQMIVKN